MLLAILVTYSRLAPEETYNVSREGIVGGLSRIVVELNFPIALVAIAITLVALSALPSAALVGRRAGDRALRGDGGARRRRPARPRRPLGERRPRGRRCDRARPHGRRRAPCRNGLRSAAPARPGAGRPRRRRARSVSIPWIAAILGFYLPEGIFLMERPAIEDGVTIAAVHLGQHHGFMGALIVVSALLLSRPRLAPGRLAWAIRLYVSLAFAYGAVNMTQDAWNEQLWKRGTVDWKIPSALPAQARPDLARDGRARGAHGAGAPSGEPDVDSAPHDRRARAPHAAPPSIAADYLESLDDPRPVGPTQTHRRGCYAAALARTAARTAPTDPTRGHRGRWRRASPGSPA